MSVESPAQRGKTLWPPRCLEWVALLAPSSGVSRFGLEAVSPSRPESSQCAERSRGQGWPASSRATAPFARRAASLTAASTAPDSGRSGTSPRAVGRACYPLQTAKSPRRSSGAHRRTTESFGRSSASVARRRPHHAAGRSRPKVRRDAPPRAKAAEGPCPRTPGSRRGQVASPAQSTPASGGRPHRVGGKWCRASWGVRPGAKRTRRGTQGGEAATPASPETRRSDEPRAAAADRPVPAAWQRRNRRFNTEITEKQEGRARVSGAGGYGRYGFAAGGMQAGARGVAFFSVISSFSAISVPETNDRAARTCIVRARPVAPPCCRLGATARPGPAHPGAWARRRRRFRPAG